MKIRGSQQHLKTTVRKTVLKPILFTIKCTLFAELLSRDYFPLY